MRQAGLIVSSVIFTSVVADMPLPASDGDDTLIIQRLIDALKDSDTEVRQNLAVALAKFGTAAVNPLIEALKDSNPDRRGGAAYALGLIGPPAKAALPALLDTLSDKEPDVRRQASYAIGRLLPQREPRPAARPGSDPPPLRGVFQ
jgi:HEAT repeat protein